MSDYLDRPLEKDPVIEFFKKDVDISLLVANLKLTPTQRLELLMDRQRLFDEAQRAGRAKRRAVRDTD